MESYLLRTRILKLRNNPLFSSCIYGYFRYSYFYEALEGYNSQDDPRAIMALKYMLLSKVMLNLTDDVYSISYYLSWTKIDIITGKMAQKYQGRDIDAMKAVANAHKNRSLSEFQDSLKTFANGTLPMFASA